MSRSTIVRVLHRGGLHGVALEDAAAQEETSGGYDVSGEKKEKHTSR